MHTSATALLLASSLGLTMATPTLFSRDDPVQCNALEPSSDSWEMANAPITDYDTDSCYHTSAIQSDGKTNPGLGSDCNFTGGGCREAARLENSNVYSRKYCNGGFCAIMYNYYFEKDPGCGAVGHRHDWEDIIVFVSTEDKLVKKIVHGEHNTQGGTSDLTNVLFDGNHAKMVYHRDGPGTRLFRFGTTDDDAEVENYTGAWIQPRLIGWNNWPAGDNGANLKGILFETWPDTNGISPKFWDNNNQFADRLQKAVDLNGDGATGNFNPFAPHEEPAAF